MSRIAKERKDLRIWQLSFYSLFTVCKFIGRIILNFFQYNIISIFVILEVRKPDMIQTILDEVYSFLWGPAMLVLLVGTGIFLTVRLKFLPFRNLPYALSLVFKRHDKKDGSGDISPFQSLMTALAATIGTGNIAGVAAALVSGGPGAVVWMWISALFGLSTKYAESVLAVKYREKNERGEMCGGPMYAMKNGFKLKALGKIMAFLFSLFTVMASFGIGNMTQANSISSGLMSAFGIPAWITGIIISVLILLILLGGIKSIGKVCGVIVPVMAVGYIVSALIVIAVNIENVPSGLLSMINSAFSFRSVGGGILGITVVKAIQSGVSRGVFSNEAGLGSAPIAAAAANTDSPSRQAYINMTGTFFDTLLVCSMTAIAIASSGVLEYSASTGADLTIEAFESALGPVGGYVVAIGLVFFAFSTILGWEYYGEKALEYFVKKRAVLIAYRLIYSAMCFIGATAQLSVVWKFSDIANALMAIPNLICLILLSPVVAKECFEYQKKKKAKGS